MAMASHAAHPSLDVGNLCKPRSHILSSAHRAFCKHRDSSSSLHTIPRRRGRSLSLRVEASTNAASVVAPKELDGGDLRRRISRKLVDEQPFKVQELQSAEKKPWHPASVLEVRDLAPGVRSIILEVECSRELVHLENAYIAPGQRAQLKINGGEVTQVPVASPPFTKKANEAVLYKLRGDIPAGSTKQPQYFLSVKIPLELLAFQSHNPQVFGLKEEDEVELGPFDYSGLDLRPILFLARFPSILLFASGQGIAVAKSIIEAKDADVGSMNLGRREESRLFYWASEPSAVLYQDNFDDWETKKLKVRAAVKEPSGQQWSGHVGSFSTLWDDDDIEYDPDFTAAIVAVEPDLRNEVLKFLTEGGISEKQILHWEP